MPDNSSLKDTHIARSHCGRSFPGLLGLLLSLSFFWMACSSEEQPPIAPERMSKVLFDLQTAEDYSIGRFADTSVEHSSEKNTDTLAVYYAMVLQHHQLSVDELDQALNWYYAHPLVMDSVYHRIITLSNTYQKLIPGDEKDTAQAQSPAAGDSLNGPAPATSVPKRAPDPGRPNRDEMSAPDRTEDEALQEIRTKNKNIKETLDKVKQQDQ